MRLVTLLAALLLAGCHADKDNDGYDDTDDCDDGTDTVNPGQTEVCDGIDNDCDGKVDEGLAVDWHPDADADGYGNPAVVDTDCEQSEGWVDNALDCDDSSDQFHPGATEEDCDDPNDYNCDGSVMYEDADGDAHAACIDCDDSDPAVHPGAEEYCNETDDDCDGTIDEGATDAATWYIDYDHDGYGADSYSLQQCEQPVGYADNAFDCNDTNAAAFPDATEFCDGVDNDCDGEIDGEGSVDATAAYVDLDDDGFGDDATLQYVCESSGTLVDVGGDCDDGDPDVNPDALEVCNDGIDNDCDGGSHGCWMPIDDAPARLLGEAANDRAGRSVAAAGDVDGDGQADLVVGAAQADGSAGDEGVAYLLHGPIAAGDTILSDADIRLEGTASDTRTGWLVAGDGDFDGDGLDDVLVAASVASDLASRSGSVYLVTGATLASAASTFSLADTAQRWSGAAAIDWVGTGLSQMDDLDGDGLSDFLIGATGADGPGLDQSGAVYIAWGDASPSGTTSTSSLGDKLYGEAASLYLGSVLAMAGDLNGDGQPDVAVGAYLAEFAAAGAGSLYLVDEPWSGTVSTADAAIRLDGTNTADGAATLVAAPGDIDGDGYADLWVGTRGDDEGAAEAGAVYLLPGRADLDSLGGTLLEAAATAKVLGADTGDGVGSALAGMDLDGDGVSDLVLGMVYDGDDNEGGGRLLYGPFSGRVDALDDAAAFFQGDEATDHDGSLVVDLGDALGTGEAVVGIAGWEDDANGTDSGTVFLLTNPGL